MAEFDEALISAVKDYSCLYNTKSGDYKVTWKKENAWAEIAKRLKTNIDVVMKCWKVLRERYTKEHKKRKKPTGTGADEVVKEWEFFHLMDFLKDFVRHRNTVANLPEPVECKSGLAGDNETTDTDTTSYESELLESNSPSTSTPKTSSSSSRDNSRTVTPTPTCKPSKRRKLESDPIEQEILQQLRSTSCTTKSVPDDDEDFAYGRTIAFSFKKLQPHLKAQAKIKIQQLLYDLEFSQQIHTEPVQLSPHTFSTV